MRPAGRRDPLRAKVVTAVVRPATVQLLVGIECPSTDRDALWFATGSGTALLRLSSPPGGAAISRKLFLRCSEAVGISTSFTLSSERQRRLVMWQTRSGTRTKSLPPQCWMQWAQKT
jgi:hypothetical protein